MCIKYKHTFPQARAHAHTRTCEPHVVQCSVKQPELSTAVSLPKEMRPQKRRNIQSVRSKEQRGGGLTSVHSRWRMEVILCSCSLCCLPAGAGMEETSANCASPPFYRKNCGSKKALPQLGVSDFYFFLSVKPETELQSTAAWCLSSNMFMVHDLWLWFLSIHEEFVFHVQSHTCV